MPSGLVKARHKRPGTRPVHLAIAAVAALTLMGGHVAARGSRSQTAIESVRSRTAGDPIMAIVSLRSQRITIYDAQGWILRAPVSSGQKGRETPAGIFSVIQKDAEHYSNLYDDAYMPNMQRITWSGIALHGGALPGYAASHGCVRMPYDFAADLFDVTKLGLRVIIAPTDVAPVEIAHPLLFQPKTGDVAAEVAARTAEANEATRKADEAKRAAGAAFREQTRAMVPVRVADNQKLRAEAQLTAAEAALSAATSPEAKQQAEDAKAKATAGIADLETQLSAAKAELQSKVDAVTATRTASDAAETARAAAVEQVRQAARQLEPVSVLISRKTQKLYVRQSFEPIFESPVTIADPDRPIGTHIFTAMERAGDDSKLRWSVVTLEGARPQAAAAEPPVGAPRGRRAATPVSTEPDDGKDSAKDALDRITIPQDVLDRIGGAGPRSSLIVTDEAPSTETGKGTDFVVLLSDQPQGGIKFRRHSPSPEVSYSGNYATYGRQRDFTSYWHPQVGRPFW
jgi:hypothetical protein